MINKVKQNTDNPISVIGGGLAGCEAAWQIAKLGIPVKLFEMRPARTTEAHVTDKLAELVCSNSFRSNDANHNAVGLLKEEMSQMGSLIMHCAEKNLVPAGGALAVDRDSFSDTVQESILLNPLINIVRKEVTAIVPQNLDSTIIATGPLTSPSLSKAIVDLTGHTNLAFFDAIAPIIHKDSINFEIAWFQSRYDKGNGADYINCPMSEEQYLTFVRDLLEAEKVSFKEWEKSTPYFESCLPIEVMAERGPKTLSFGPLKPVGLSDIHNPSKKPAAIVQLRQDNKIGTLYNMVGFQTKLKFGEQKRIFQKIPGLENAEFARYGGLHRNTFINGPKLLGKTLELKSKQAIRFAGQITGCEGYVESASIGLLAGRFAAFERLGLDLSLPPAETAIGALLYHITGGANEETYQPMNINFGLFPELRSFSDQNFNNKIKRLKAKDKKYAITQRSRKSMSKWLSKIDKLQIRQERF